MSATPPLRSLRAFRFARNTGFNLLGQLGTVAISFFATPYLVARLGKEPYGFYLLLYTVGTYLLLLTFGAGLGALKFTAEFAGSQDARGSRDALRHAALLSVAGVLPGALLVLLGADFLAERVLSAPQSLHASGAFTLRCAAAAAVAIGLLHAAQGSLQGLQRFDLHNLLLILQQALTLLGATLLVGRGWGLRAVAAWYAALNAALAALALMWTWRLLPPAPPGGPGLPFRRFVAYGAGFWLGQAASAISLQLDRLLIGALLPISELTLYGVPAGILQRLTVAPAAVGSAMLPLASALDSEEAAEALPRIYLKTLRVILWTSLPGMVLLFSLMPQFLTLWLGPEFSDRSTWPARVLIAAYTAGLLYTAPNAIAAAREKPLYSSAAIWATALISAAAWAALIPGYGIFGVAAGTLLGQALPVPFLLRAVHRLIGLRLRDYLRKGLLAPCASAGLLLAAVFPVHHLASDWPRLIGLAAAGLAVYYGSTWPLLEPDERRLLLRFLGRA